MIKLFLFFAILINFRVKLEAQYTFFKGFIDKFPIDLTLCNNESHFTGVYLYKKYNTPIEFHGSLKDGKLTLYEICIRYNWDLYKNIFTFSNINLDNDKQIGEWENIENKVKYKVKLTKTYSFNNLDSSSFDSLELMQIESTKEEYFMLLLHKKPCDFVTFYGVRVYDKRTNKLKQQIDLDEDFDKVGLDIIEVNDYNSDGTKDFSIKFYDNHGDNPWGYCFIKKDDKFIPFENCEFKY